MRSAQAVRFVLEISLVLESSGSFSSLLAVRRDVEECGHVVPLGVSFGSSLVMSSFVHG